MIHNFEEALDQLEDIVSKLEDGSINLEESIEEYTRGVHLKSLKLEHLLVCSLEILDRIKNQIGSISGS